MPGFRERGQRERGGQRGESNTVDAHNTTVSLESQKHKSTQEYLDNTSMFVVSVNEPCYGHKGIFFCDFIAISTVHFPPMLCSSEVILPLTGLNPPHLLILTYKWGHYKHLPVTMTFSNPALG